MFKRFFSFKTKHTADTARPQTYYEHWMVAVPYSLKLIGAGIGGVVHGFLPEIKRFQFATSTTIFKTAHFLMMSPRHDDEIREIYGQDMLEFIRRKRVDRAMKGPH